MELFSRLPSDFEEGYYQDNLYYYDQYPFCHLSVPIFVSCVSKHGRDDLIGTVWDLRDGFKSVREEAQVSESDITALSLFVFGRKGMVFYESNPI